MKLAYVKCILCGEMCMVSGYWAEDAQASKFTCSQCDAAELKKGNVSERMIVMCELASTALAQLSSDKEANK